MCERLSHTYISSDSAQGVPTRKTVYAGELALSCEIVKVNFVLSFVGTVLYLLLTSLGLYTFICLSHNKKIED